MELRWAPHIPALGSSMTPDSFLDARWEEEEVSAAVVVVVKRSLCHSLSQQTPSSVPMPISRRLEWWLCASVSFGCYRPVWCGLEARWTSPACLWSPICTKSAIFNLWFPLWSCFVFSCFFFFWPIVMSHCQMFHIWARYPITGYIPGYIPGYSQPTETIPANADRGKSWHLGA